MAHSMDEDRGINGLEVTAEGLLRLARRNAQATRRTYAALAAGLSGNRETDLVLTDRQRSMVSQMLRQLIGEIEANIRWHVVALMEDAGSGNISRGAALAARRGDGVVAFMLENGLLQDLDLMEAVLHRICQHQLERVLKSARDARWDIEPGLDQSGQFFFPPLSANSPAHRRIAAYLVDDSHRTDSYGNPVLLSQHIGRALHRRLYWRVAASLKYVLFPASTDDPAGEDSLLEKAATDAQRQAAALASAPTSTMEACSCLEAAGLVSGETVMRLLRAGEIPLFEAVFSHLAGISPVLLRRLVYEPGGEGIVVLARALGLDSDMAITLFERTRAAGRGLYLDDSDHAERFHAVFDGTSRQDAERVRAHWARDSEYTGALWEVETGSLRNPPPFAR